MLHYFLSDNIKQYAATTAAHGEHIIDLLKNRQLVFSDLSNIRENKCECAEHYRFSTSLYVLSIFFQAFNITIDCGISAPVHGREVVDGLNSTYRRFIFHLTTTVKLTGSQSFYTPMVMHTSTHNYGVSFAH